MSKVLDATFNFIIKWEGGYVNDPKDPGGETKYGISKRAYPTEDIKNMTKERAKFLFVRDYWSKCSCDELPECLAVMVADTAFNCGVVRAKKMLQKSFGLTEDGIFGKMSFAAFNNVKENRKDLIAATSSFYNNRLSYYKSLKTWEDFGKGWANRSLDKFDLSKKYLPKG